LNIIEYLEYFPEYRLYWSSLIKALDTMYTNSYLSDSYHCLAMSPNIAPVIFIPVESINSTFNTLVSCPFDLLVNYLYIFLTSLATICQFAKSGYKSEIF
jgi:hypothetical protein